jgi:hypothetical protein
VLEDCIGLTSLHATFDPTEYFRTHPIMIKAHVLDEVKGTLLCKYTEGAKYSSKFLIHFTEIFHDMDVCIPDLSIESGVINSPDKFNLILHKTRFTKLTREGVDTDYINVYHYSYLIEVHVSLLPLEVRAPVYMTFFDYIVHCIPNMLRRTAESFIPYRKLWAIKASYNTYMVEFLRYQDD